MRPGDEVRVKVKGTGEKVRAVVSEIQTDTTPIDITIGPNGWGIPADEYRRYMPGPVRTTITLEVIPES